MSDDFRRRQRKQYLPSTSCTGIFWARVICRRCDQQGVFGGAHGLRRLLLASRRSLRASPPRVWSSLCPECPASELPASL